MARKWLFHCDISPRVGVNPEARANVNLHKVTEALEKNSSVRDYSFDPMEDFSETPSLETPPSPNPITQATAFFRLYALSKKIRLLELKTGIDYRLLINDPEYWKCEAFFFTDRLQSGTDWRKMIVNVDYWKTESSFWEASCRLGTSNASREQITDSTYWRCEADFMRTEWERQHSQDAESMRSNIHHQYYWECENSRYNEELESGSSTPDYDIPSAMPKWMKELAGANTAPSLSLNVDNGLSPPDKLDQADDNGAQLHQITCLPQAPLSFSADSGRSKSSPWEAVNPAVSPGTAIESSKRRLESDDGQSDRILNRTDPRDLLRRKRRRTEEKSMEGASPSASDEGILIAGFVKSTAQADSALSRSSISSSQEPLDEVQSESTSVEILNPPRSSSSLTEIDGPVWKCTATLNSTLIPI